MVLAVYDTKLLHTFVTHPETPLINALHCYQKVSFLNGSESSRDRVTRRFKRIIDTVTKEAPAVDFTKLHNTLFSLERELGSWNVNGTGQCDTL